MDGMRLGPGSVLNGRYVVKRSLGQGGFGITYEVEDHVLGSRFAIKEYFPDSLSARLQDGRVMPRTPAAAVPFEKHRGEFRREAEALSAFDNPNIVKVVARFDQNNTSYFVMEFVDGENLMDVCNRGPMPAATVMVIAEYLLEGVKLVHDRGRLHRDIKPANIILARNDGTHASRMNATKDVLRKYGRPVLLDFGSARILAANAGPMTGMMTPGFGAPEQSVEHGIQDARTDIYGVCATLYALLSGATPPSSGERASVDRLRPAVHAFAGQAPGPFLRAIDRGLSLKASDRQKNIRQLRNELFAELPSAGEPAYPLRIETDARRAAPAAPPPPRQPMRASQSDFGPLDATLVSPAKLRVGMREVLQAAIHAKGQRIGSDDFLRATAPSGYAQMEQGSGEVGIYAVSEGAVISPAMQWRRFDQQPALFTLDVDAYREAPSASITLHFQTRDIQFGAAHIRCQTTLSGKSRGVSKVRMKRHRKVYLSAVDQAASAAVAKIYRRWEVDVVQNDLRQVDRCDLLHVVWTPDAANSPHVEQELMQVLGMTGRKGVRRPAIFVQLEPDGPLAPPSAMLERAGFFDILRSTRSPQQF